MTDSTGERLLAPDLARGCALLLVALSHATSIFLACTPGVDQHPQGFERPYFVAMFLVVHACALPLFGIMLGYGLVQFSRRQEALGYSWPQTRGVLLRRHGWMFVFGAVDGILLYSGDVLGAYGLIGLVFTLLLLRRGRRVYWFPVGYIGFGVLYLAVFMVLVVQGMVAHPNADAAVPSPPDNSSLADSYGAAVGYRLEEWPISVASGSRSRALCRWG